MTLVPQGSCTFWVPRLQPCGFYVLQMLRIKTKPWIIIYNFSVIIPSLISLQHLLFDLLSSLLYSVRALLKSSQCPRQLALWKSRLTSFLSSASFLFHHGTSLLAHLSVSLYPALYALIIALWRWIASVSNLWPVSRDYSILCISHPRSSLKTFHLSN